MTENIPEGMYVLMDFKHIENTEALVKAIVARRKELKLSQSELAKLCNLSTNGISKFESSPGSREVKLSTIFKISEVLGFKLHLGFEE